MSMSIEERLDRLESLDEIRQLAAKYSVTLDMRDLDMHVNLFVPDVRVGKNGEGRQALASLRPHQPQASNDLVALDLLELHLKA